MRDFIWYIIWRHFHHLHHISYTNFGSIQDGKISRDWIFYFVFSHCRYHSSPIGQFLIFMRCFVFYSIFTRIGTCRKSKSTVAEKGTEHLEVAASNEHFSVTWDSFIVFYSSLRHLVHALCNHISSLNTCNKINLF